MSKFLMNTWYMGAWGHEVTDTPLSRRMLGVPMVFYRLRGGSVTALRDRCPHRFAYLSKGRVVDDAIQCPYHGLVFGPTGKCIDSPLSKTVPEGAVVQQFPVIERHNIVWFWPGDPAQADPAKIPDFSYLEDPAYRTVYGLTPVKAHYEVETDNLMDLSHVNWVHPPFSGALNKESSYKAFRDGNAIHSNWFSAGTSNPPIYEYGSFPTNGGLVDQWIEMRWHAPAAMFLEIAITKTGEERAAGLTLVSCHMLTPETEHSTNYFWSASLPQSDPMPLDFFQMAVSQAFDNEDKPMLEDIEAEMENTDLLSLRPVILPSDRGAVMARRTLAAMIRREQGGVADDQDVDALDLVPVG